MPVKVRCTACHRKLNGNFTGKDCLRPGCPEKDKELFEVLTFKDWKDDKFEVISELEVADKWADYNWPEHTPNTDTHFWNPITNEWELKIPTNEDMSGFC